MPFFDINEREIRQQLMLTKLQEQLNSRELLCDNRQVFGYEFFEPLDASQYRQRLAECRSSFLCEEHVASAFDGGLLSAFYDVVDRDFLMTTSFRKANNLLPHFGLWLKEP